MGIWLTTPNPLDLPAPPAWWQKLVEDYDANLRLMPSQKDYVYRLCRLVRREARMGLSHTVVHDHPDTVEMIRHYCIPVATISRFSPLIIDELKGRDLWRAENRNIVDRMDYEEERAKQKQDATHAEDLFHAAGDAFRSLKTQLGERVSLRDVNRGRVGSTATPNRVSVGMTPQRSRTLRELFR